MDIRILFFIQTKISSNEILIVESFDSEVFKSFKQNRFLSLSLFFCL